jgi:hypothetical protein
MPEDLERERFELDKQKASDEAELERQRFLFEKAKFARDNHIFNRNFGVLITAATAVLGVSLSAAQVWVAYIQKDRESSQRGHETELSQLEKSREFDFEESKDLREFVIKNYSEITSKDDTVRNNIKDLMLLTYRPGIVNPVVERLRAFSPAQQRSTWDQADAELAGFSAARAPEQAWCYQERKQSGSFGVYCHSSAANCNDAKQGSKTATQCILVGGLSQTGWHPLPKGFKNSWYQEGMADPLPAPFPQP